MKLIRPALSCSNNADNMAILKRSVFLVFSKDYIYFRFPSEQQVSVHRFSFAKHDVLKDTSKPIYSNYKKDGPVPLDFEDKIAWESEWLKEAFRKFDAAQAESRRARASDAPPPPPLVHAVKLEMWEFDAAHAGLAEATLNDPVDVNTDPGAPSTLPAGPSRPDSSVNIKQEQFEAANASFLLGAQAWSRSLSSSGAVIDLSSSPAKSLPGSEDLPEQVHNDYAHLSSLVPQPDPCLSLPSDLPSPPETVAPSAALADELDPTATWPAYPGDALKHGVGDAEDTMDVEDSAAGEGAHESY